MTRTSTLGLPIDAIADIHQVVQAIGDAVGNRTFLVTFVNPATVVAAQRATAAKLFEPFDLVLPDGIAAALAIRWLHHLPASRISFDSTSLAPPVMALAVDRDLRVMLVGGQPGVAQRAGEQLKIAYPGLNVVATVDGYSVHATIIETINRLAPDIVVCGLGNVLQESFLLELSESGWSGIGITCGGYFDQLSRGIRYYPQFIDTLQLRWLYRLAKEPRRLWRRYLIDYPRFAVSLAVALVKRV